MGTDERFTITVVTVAARATAYTLIIVLLRTAQSSEIIVVIACQFSGGQSRILPH